jgi:hypothetical protein
LTAADVEKRVSAAKSDNARLRLAIEAASLPGVVDQEASRAAFVVDTSGSMRDPNGGGLYVSVVKTMLETLSANPMLRYFQVFDGDGRYAISGTEGKWLPNDGEARSSAEAALQRYKQDTVSNPVPGIMAALRALDAGKDPLSRMHIFVLGDELNSQDRSTLLLAQIDELNPADREGRRRVTISGIAFPTWQAHTAVIGQSPANVPAAPRTYLRFTRLMSELAKFHGGTFVNANAIGR